MHPRPPKQPAVELSWRARLDALRNVRPLLGMVWETSPPLVVATVFLRLLRALMPLAALWVPKLPLRHKTPGRIARSAGLFVGATPAECTKVHKAWRSLRISRHMPSVFGTPHVLPASSSRSTSRRTGLM